MVSNYSPERRHKAHAKALIGLVERATLGELSALDEIVRHLLSGGLGGGGQQYELHADVMGIVFA